MIALGASGGIALALAACSPSGSEQSYSEPDIKVTVSPDKTPTPEVTVTTSPTTEPSPSSKIPAPSVSSEYVDCTPLERGTPNVVCTAKAKGIFRLLNQRGRPLDAEVADKGKTFNLTSESGVHTLDCYKARVSFFALPKNGTGLSVDAYSFDICSPSIENKSPNVPSPTPTSSIEFMSN